MDPINVDKYTCYYSIEFNNRCVINTVQLCSVYKVIYIFKAYIVSNWSIVNIMNSLVCYKIITV